MIKLYIPNNISDFQVTLLKQHTHLSLIESDIISLDCNTGQLDRLLSIAGWPIQWLVDNGTWLIAPDGLMSPSNNTNIDTNLAGFLADQFWYNVPLRFPTGFIIDQNSKVKLIQTFKPLKGLKPSVVVKDGLAELLDGTLINATCSRLAHLKTTAGWHPHQN